ncbi:ABC transporter substrate-binding protein [Actinophytocola sp.]|uniref:ABC transporter substrate-binding protein n=1 Tax=Actinophytocola sp. TaxID=1872138 RepID=UPI003D6B384B
MARSPVRITFACGDYDRVRPLRDGRVVPAGVVLEHTVMPSHRIFHEQVRFRRWDVSEMSLGSYLTLAARAGHPGENPFVAIPVFTSRYFRHGFIWTNTASGIEWPEDLKGRRIGVPDYHMTAAIWMRGMLSDDHGVRAQDVHWLTGGLNTPGGTERIRLDVPGIRPGIHIEPVPEDRTLDEMLASGEIDALMAALPPRSFERGDPRVRRLFADHVSAERDYYLRRGNFPIMHCVALRREVHEAYPWLARSLLDAFGEAKDLCLRELEAPGALPVTLPWLTDFLAEVRAVLGEDFWPYGVEPNRHDLATLIRYGEEQGLLARPLSVDELFAPSTLSGSTVSGSAVSGSPVSGGTT